MNQVADTESLNVGLPEVFKALGDPLRFNIVRLMQRDSFGVLELCELFNVRQPAMSHHLKLMVEAGLLTSRREGNSLFYRRILPEQSDSSEAVKALFTLIDKVPMSSANANALAKIRASRTEQSIAFFQKNSTRFRDQQDLIAGYGDYGQAIVDAVQALFISSTKKPNFWIEVGAGEGELLSALHQDFVRVKAVDVSKELIARAQKKVSQANNIEFSLGELSADSSSQNADLVSCNMVLHHIASPAGLVDAMASCLRPGGYLVLSDLCSHDQEWARESCGDMWLGFEPEELYEMAASAGLKAQSEEYLALRNGFRVQILIFKK